MKFQENIRDRFDEERGSITAPEEGRVNPSASERTLGDYAYDLISRRGVLRSGLVGGTVLALSACESRTGVGSEGLFSATDQKTPSDFDFTEVSAGADDKLHVPQEFEYEVLIRWGDPLSPDVGAFDPRRQTPAEQEKRFGENNDFTALFALPKGVKNPDRMLLCVNNEYTNEAELFEKPEGENGAYSQAQSEISQSSIGVSVVEIKRKAEGGFSYLQDSPYNRRITLRTTAIKISGPAKGSERMKTSADPQGEIVIGTAQNCAGGVTPWGTYLTCEENINYLFNTKTPEKIEADALKRLKRFDFGGKSNPFYLYDDRFDPVKEPNEPNRFGWVVEINPYDPASVPVKRTALGRFKHECCTCVISKSGYLVAYMGDDQYFEYLYKFVSSRKYDAVRPENNKDLLDDGTLFVAEFDENHNMVWKALQYGTNGLNAENGFFSQADVVIEARRAGDLVGATPLDRPEDVEIHPVTGKVYVTLTMNEKRTETNAVNPRMHNAHGQILEITPNNGDHAATTGKWDFLFLAGPARDGGTINPESDASGILSSPDNLAFDKKGRLWVATDQGADWHIKSGSANGLFAVNTEGKHRGRSKRFLRTPIGAEVTGVTFMPDEKHLIVSVQHPGAEGAQNWKAFGRESVFNDPATRFPDFKPNMPPRSSVVVIRRKNGKPI